MPIGIFCQYRTPIRKIKMFFVSSNFLGAVHSSKGVAIRFIIFSPRSIIPRDFLVKIKCFNVSSKFRFYLTIVLFSLSVTEDVVAELRKVRPWLFTELYPIFLQFFQRVKGALWFGKPIMDVRRVVVKNLGVAPQHIADLDPLPNRPLVFKIRKLCV